MSEFGTRFFKGNGMMCCKQQHPLLLDCLALTTFPRYIRTIGRANNSTFKPLMVNTVSLRLKIALNFHVKYQLFSSLYKQETGYCDARRDTHCYLNASWPSMDVWRWLEELLVASTSPLLSRSCHLFQINNYKFYDISGTLSAWEIWGCATRSNIHCYSSVSQPSLDM